MTRIRIFPVVFAGVLCATLAGCDEQLPIRVPVSGTVLIDGKPLTSGRIQFVPEDGRAALSPIDKEGRFTLTTFDLGDGCIQGTHRIAVYAFEDLNPTTRRWDAPRQYIDVKTSGLKQEINGPTDSLEIQLTWGGKTGPIMEHLTNGGDED